MGLAEVDYSMEAASMNTKSINMILLTWFLTEIMFPNVAL